ncbi:IMP-specific 5'-nucleotidase [Gregarina niphandrodes]|uniref:IMP-specific 5'-nucleotidase 1 n=1 Tax=Gregarina niphandrodes TaxID=110365 RepID=A0A023B0E5_GRENI|nr:IMP-specific 5'-nucleotidase [Gregarina niphandrodes]EZG45213.1 IMP-specific 5'-nucleotidase [Gregarina niphandrodes]|eukprot:XP_011132540.1 IMP-specific 5'-nucleotidase [Gregarina niphandrodes]
MEIMEKALLDHFKNPKLSPLNRRLGPIRLFTHLPVHEAFKKYDQKYRITKRRHIPPSIHECRQTFNLAQVLVSAPGLKLVTFDGDETLYPDGHNFEDGELSNLIIHILKTDCHVALVTAAGYGQDPSPYLNRLGRLIPDIVFATSRDTKMRTRFWVFGGESNYLFNLSEDGQLRVVAYHQWESFSPIGFTESRNLHECSRLLDVAEVALRAGVKDLGLRARVIRKERAAGVIPGGSTAYMPVGSGARKIKQEILEELVCRVRDAVTAADCTGIPYCAFNGGRDVWVDVGNKAIALRVLKSMLALDSTECLHIGDQFTESGNDTSVRNESPCIWVINPDETKAILRRICRGRGIKDYEQKIVLSDNEAQVQTPLLIADLLADEASNDDGGQTDDW